ncbi:MAG: hypothetical protein CMJ58_19045 [Planctomycetaceae bacterium]|nr:hypothetical protein [Planctomycetaceae bacterium]
MKKIVLTAAVAAVLSSALAGAPRRALGQDFDFAAEQPAAAEDDSYYTAPPVREPQLSVAQQKSMARAQQRMARLDAMRAYGMSASRPTAISIPFTGMYSTAWQMPGGRPFGWWHSAHRSVVIIR